MSGASPSRGPRLLQCTPGRSNPARRSARGRCPLRAGAAFRGPPGVLGLRAAPATCRRTSRSAPFHFPQASSISVANRASDPNRPRRPPPARRLPPSGR
eukprot:3444515-Pyramimonas_sp.AAC.1